MAFAYGGSSHLMGGDSFGHAVGLGVVGSRTERGVRSRTPHAHRVHLVWLT